MLRTKLFRGFAALVLVFGILSALIGTRIIKSRVVDEAQRRVQLDLNGAWSVYNANLQEIETIIRLAASKRVFAEVLGGDTAREQEAVGRLQFIQQNFELDFLTVVDKDGTVLMRGSPPHVTGDILLSDPAVVRAMKGTVASGTALYSGERLSREGEGLQERAFLVLEDTPRSRPTPRKEESRGMVMVTAAPVMEGLNVVGVIYGGILLNRNEKIIDHIKEVIYDAEVYNGTPLGTATIFLNDSRITTTVRQANGNRALGTRVSKVVADRVLDNRMPWIDRAFVVKDWYLSAYDPIVDFNDQVIGMLYVGILEAPFKAVGRQIIFRYAMLLAFGLAGALVLAYLIAGRLSQPIHELVGAAAVMQRGEPHSPVICNGACQETASLVVSFNQMAEALEERETRLKEANASLTALNQSYMDMLGFVSHELKSPVSSIINYTYLLEQEKIGDLTDKQQRAVSNIDTSAKRIVEMVRHYLNLSRIENGEMDPVMTDVNLINDVLTPLVESLEKDLKDKQMVLENRIPADLVTRTDLNMTREVFENLVGNAVKYGREQGRIRLTAEIDEDRVHFVVANEGEGIPEEKIETLFTKFTRLEQGPEAKRQKGTGLGLFITKHIVEAHGGKVSVTSTPGKWTAFEFSLPLSKNVKE